MTPEIEVLKARAEDAAHNCDRSLGQVATEYHFLGQEVKASKAYALKEQLSDLINTIKDL